MNARSRYEALLESNRKADEFIASHPEPMATLAEVLEVPCTTCGAAAGDPCDTSPPYLSVLWMVFPELGSVHTRRYQDRSGDRR